VTPNPGAAIRRADTGDVDRLVEHHREYSVHDGHEVDEAAARAAFGPLLDDDTYGVVLIVDEPAAYAVLTWGWSIEGGGLEGVLDEIYARERGRGLGSALIDAVLGEATDRGLSRVFLETEAPNGRARRLYARHGFVEESSIWMTRPLAGPSSAPI